MAFFFIKFINNFGLSYNESLVLKEWVQCNTSAAQKQAQTNYYYYLLLLLLLLILLLLVLFNMNRKRRKVVFKVAQRRTVVLKSETANGNIVIVSERNNLSIQYF